MTAQALRGRYWFGGTDRHGVTPRPWLKSESFPEAVWDSRQRQLTTSTRFRGARDLDVDVLPDRAPGRLADGAGRTPR